VDDKHNPESADVHSQYGGKIMSSANLFDLSGHVAVVTGGNGGIGRSIALGLAQAGAAIAVLARNEEKNQRVLGEPKALGGPALAHRVDVAVRGQLQPALEQVEQTLGPVSILVNNAGIAAVGGVLEQAPEDWDRVIETNLNACFLLSKLAAASMVKQRRGKIINIASMYALFGAAFAPSYSAAKGALVQLTKSMAIELAPFNIQVNALALEDVGEVIRKEPIQYNSKGEKSYAIRHCREREFREHRALLRRPRLG
jgi:2-deoxy-D-gluconate 3-dehydrogenase